MVEINMHPDALDLDVSTDNIDIQERKIERDRFRDKMTITGQASFSLEGLRGNVEIVDFDVYDYNFELGSYENDEPIDPEIEGNALTVFGSVDATSFKRRFRPDAEYFESVFGVMNSFELGLMDSTSMDWYTDLMGVLEDMYDMKDDLGGNIDTSARAYKKKWKEIIKVHGKDKIFGPRGVLNFLLAFNRAKTAYDPLDAICVREMPEDFEAGDFGIGLSDGALRLQSGTVEDEESERFCRVASGTRAESEEEEETGEAEETEEVEEETGESSEEEEGGPDLDKFLEFFEKKESDFREKFIKRFSFLRFEGKSLQEAADEFVKNLKNLLKEKITGEEKGERGSWERSEQAKLTENEIKEIFNKLFGLSKTDQSEEKIKEIFNNLFGLSEIEESQEEKLKREFNEFFEYDFKPLLMEGWEYMVPAGQEESRKDSGEEESEPDKDDKDKNKSPGPQGNEFIEKIS